MTTPLPQTETAGKPERLVFLDVLRGMTVAFMILVNNNGDEEVAYAQLKHTAWNGWTLTDLVFPTFLFLVGITIVLSTSSRLRRGEATGRLLAQAGKRAAILFLLGIVIHGFPHYPLATLRIFGVLQRIAVCYFLCTLIYLWTRRVSALISITAVCLIGYWILLRWVPIAGVGMPGRDFPFMDPDLNIVSVVDRMLFPGRLFEHTRDPLGLISTLPAVGTCLLGVLCGMYLRTSAAVQKKAQVLLVWGMTLVAAGLFWSQWFPINKRLWTSSYVLFAGGCTLLLLTALFYLIDIRKHDGAWTFPWRVFGSNALFVYAFSELLSSVVNVFPVSGKEGLRSYLFERYLAYTLSPAFAYLLYSICFLCVCFLPCLVLYRRRIFVKI